MPEADRKREEKHCVREGRLRYHADATIGTWQQDPDLQGGEEVTTLCSLSPHYTAQRSAVSVKAWRHLQCLPRFCISTNRSNSSQARQKFLPNLNPHRNALTHRHKHVLPRRTKVQHCYNPWQAAYVSFLFKKKKKKEATHTAEWSYFCIFFKYPPWGPRN